MIKVIVTENFTLSKFDEIKNLKRFDLRKNGYGYLYVNDEFECTEEMYKYLTEDNKLKRAFVKFIEIIPDKQDKIINQEEIKPRRRRKTVAKK